MNPRPDEPAGEPPEQKPSDRQLVGRLLRLAWVYRWGCVKLLLLQVVMLALGLSGLSIVGVGIDYIKFEALVGSIPTVKPPRWPFGLEPPPDWPPLMVLGVIAAGVLAFALVRIMLNVYASIETQKLVQGRVVVDLRSQAYNAMQRLGFRFFDTNQRGSLMNRVTGDTQSVRMFIDGVAVPTVILLLSLAVFLVYMLSIQISLTLACLATTPLLWTATRAFARKVRPEYVKERELFDRQIMILSENINGAHVVKGFGREPGEIDKYSAANTATKKQKDWIFDMVSFFQPAIGMITQFNIVVMLGYGGFLVIRYEGAPDIATAVKIGLSVGELMIFNSLLQQFSGQVANIANIANNLQQCLIASRRVFEVFDTPREIASPADPVRVPRLSGAVTFEHVSFSYNGMDPVLRDIQLSVAPGERIAIMGITGSGKSTLLSLLPRFYDPSDGRILMDGIDTRQIDLAGLRRNIGMVFQESFLFSNSVAANIAYGLPDASQRDIERAARVARAHDFIMEMPEGYSTILREGGATLSGGQRQRLALARAILLDPPILLLDDPTAAIDAGTEHEIFDALESATNGHTTFIVTHRLSTLKRASRILVMAGGRIVQTGTHRDLIGREGHYRQTAEMQTPDSETSVLLGLERDI